MTIGNFITLILLLAISFLSGALVYVLFDRNSNTIIDRLKRGNVAPKRSIMDDLLEFIKPLTEANLKGNRNKNTVRQMFIKLGMSATDADIMDFENKRMLRLIIAFFFGVLMCVILIPAFKDPTIELLVGTVFICMPTFMVYKAPTWELVRRIKAKEKAFEKYFPDAIDLLCVCVEAGLGIDAAIERVGREFSNFSKEVGSEFNRVAKDMLSGVSKQEALKGLTERVESKDIQSFVAVIIQADKMGASISNSLAISADSIRTRRKQRLEALVSAASTKMTIPLVLCLLPATFAVILTPAIIQVVESLGKMNGFK